MNNIISEENSQVTKSPLESRLSELEVKYSLWCWSCQNVESMLKCESKQECSEDSICFVEQRTRVTDVANKILITAGCKVCDFLHNSI